MGTLRDRVRRILSDGAKDGPSREESQRLAPSSRQRELRARLEALGLDRNPPPSPHSEALAECPWFAADDGRSLEEQVGGSERDTLHGALLFVERRIPLHGRHGTSLLAEAVRHAVPLRAHEQGPRSASTLRPEEVVFLDTETTGLSGGTGTVAFLVGTGRVEGDSEFVIRQYCMRDFPEEAALLHALAEDVGDAPIVTFNGRSFDWPLLATRFRLHRMKVGRRAHLDLLPPSRRLWADSLSSHTLAALEQHVLGLERENDLPGWRIPQAYFDYLRTGRAGLVAMAFRHNEIDVVSMLALMGRVGAILGAPAERPAATARDHLGTARLLLELRDAEGAKASLQAGLEKARDGEATPLLRQLGHLCRREGNHEEALEHWVRLARTAPAFDVEAFEQVAKIHEHRRRDYAGALRWVEEALSLATEGSRAEDALRHREERLLRRLGGAPTC